MRWAVLGAAVVGALLGAGRGAAEPVRVMTFNVRYSTAPDGENRWELRRDLLLRVIAEFDPDVLGVQEALRDQVDAFRQALPDHTCVGVGREADGGGEYSAVYFRSGRFDLMAAETFWLSDTPDVAGSRTWGNTLPRICTEVRLFDRSRGRRFAVLNTHWDHQSHESRVQSGRLMAERVAGHVAAGMPVLVVGDFNAGEEDAAMGELTRRGELLSDTFRRLHSEEIAGTFHAFGGSAGSRKIDAVLATGGWRVSEAAVVRTNDGGRYPSDHFPVTAVVELPGD